SSIRHPTLASCWSMIFSENRYPLFGIMATAKPLEAMLQLAQASLDLTDVNGECAGISGSKGHRTPHLKRGVFKAPPVPAIKRVRATATRLRRCPLRIAHARHDASQRRRRFN